MSGACHVRSSIVASAEAPWRGGQLDPVMEGVVGRLLDA